MPHRLRNKQVEVIVDLPDENYKGSRFDRSGKIVEVQFLGEPVAGVELQDADKWSNCGRGFYNEFGIDSPLGYHDTQNGDWFHKIGVGLLKKSEEQYSFSKGYEVRVCDFAMESAQDRIQFECYAPAHNGYSYQLYKEIALTESGFVVNYRLENTGAKQIVTDEYNHNFISIGKELISKDYTLKWPFQLRSDQVDAYVNPDQVVNWRQYELRFSHTPKEAFFFSNLSGGTRVAASWELINSQRKLGIRETGDFQTKKVNVWGCGHVISPELFFEIALQPGQSVRWSRRYDLFRLDG